MTRKLILTLFNAIRSTGWIPIRCDRPGSHPDRIGTQQAHSKAAILKNGRIAVKGDSWDYAYEVAHEICEFHHGFKHSELFFMNQSNLLAMWHVFRSKGRAPKLIGTFFYKD